MSIAFFVPHLGCPHDCSFCNQHTISGAEHPVTPQEVADTLEKAREQLGKNTRQTEIAFFGGSFTAIDPEYRKSLLETASCFCEGNSFTGIRVSTRPDAISKSILDELRAHHVKVVELGAQSMNDRVLQKNNRGHTAQDVREASGLVKQFGLTLILQMMTGLYGDSDEGAMQTARELAALRPNGVRIYPTLTLQGTHLERLYGQGGYHPQPLENAVTLGAKLLRFFEEQQIPVIRMGLHDSEGIAGNLVAGPYHPAFRELCEGRLLAEELLQQIQERKLPPGELAVRVPAKDLSKLTGHGRRALASLEAAGYRVSVIADNKTNCMIVN